MGGAVCPPCCFTYEKTVVEVMKTMATSFKRSSACTAALSAPDPAIDHRQPCLCQRLPDTHRQVWVSLLWGHCSFLLLEGNEGQVWCWHSLCVVSGVCSTFCLRHRQENARCQLDGSVFPHMSRKTAKMLTQESWSMVFCGIMLWMVIVVNASDLVQNMFLGNRWHR